MSNVRSNHGRGGRWMAAMVIGLLGLSGVATAGGDEPTGNMVFFRGGFMNLNEDRSGQIVSDTGGLTGQNGGNAGWYAGAGLDMVLSKDMWGGMDKTWWSAKSASSSTTSIPLG